MPFVLVASGILLAAPLVPYLVDEPDAAHVTALAHGALDLVFCHLADAIKPGGSLWPQSRPDHDPAWARELRGGFRAWLQVHRDQRRHADAGRYDEHSCAEAIGGRVRKRRAGEALRSGIGYEDEECESDGGSNRGARRDKTGSDALLTVGHPGRRRDEHGGERDSVTKAQRDQSWSQSWVPACLGHREADCHRA